MWSQVLVQLFLALTAPVLPDLALPDLAEALSAPRLVGTDLAPELTEYSVGGLHLEVGAGAVFPVLVDDRTVGLFFYGKGSFAVIADDPVSAELVELNLRRASPFRIDAGSISGNLEAALVLDSRMATTDGGAVDAKQPVPDAVAKAFARHLERFGQDRLLDPPNQIAQAILDASSERVAIVQMESAKADLLYRYDELALHEEALFIMQRYPNDSALRGQRFPMLLSARPLTGEWLQRRPPRFVLRHVDLELVNRQEAALDLVVEEHLEILTPVDTLEFSLWSEIFHRRKSHEYTLRGVTLGDGTALPFSHRNGDLVVALPEVVQPGEQVLLRFSLGGDVLQRPSGHSYWWLPIGSWLPLPPRFDMRSYTVHAVVKAASPFIPFGMGSTIRRWKEEGLSCLEFELDKPVQFAVVLAGKYHSYSEERDGQTITLSSYAFAQDEPMRMIADNIFELLDFYEELLGPFPYPELNILEINAFGFGIGPPGVIYLTAEGFDPGPSGRSFRKEINMRLAHEVAHMWWGHVVQMKSPDDQWLSESTAEYFAALAVDALAGRSGFKDAMRDWKAEAGDSKAAPSIYLANHLAGERAAFDRRNLLYGRGPLMLHALREEIGDEAFFEIMRRLVEENSHRHVDTGDFVVLASEVAGRDLEDWFRRELFGLG